MALARNASEVSGPPGHILQSARGSNQTAVRAHNERVVLTLIRQLGPMPKAEIARLTGLSAQTVSVIMRALEADGLLEKGEPVRGRVGQPSVPMSLAEDGAYFMGLKIGRRSLDLILTDFRGQVKGRMFREHSHPTPDGAVTFAHEAVETLISQLPATHRDRLAGLGVAMPFRLWDWAEPLGLQPGDMDTWRSRDIIDELSGAWDFPIYLQNDATAACAAELVFGDNDRPSDFLYFYIGFFIGGGIVLDNMLVTGRSGNAGALGPMPLGWRQGHQVQLIDVASLCELEKQMRAKAHPSDMIWSDPEGWAIPDDIVESWMNDAVDGIAHAIFTSCSLIDFGDVLIDGWMPENLRAEVVARTEKRLAGMKWVGLDRPNVRAGSVGSDARALGAASLPLSDNFLVDRNALLKG